MEQFRTVLGTAYPEQQNCVLCEHAWRAASFLVRAQLTTTLGGPTELFGCVEEMLKREFSNSEITHDKVVRSMALLTFVHALEQSIEALRFAQNKTSEESHVEEDILAAQQFFLASSKVCAAWFQRLRVQILKLSLQLDANQEVVSVASQYIQDKQDAGQMLNPPTPALRMARDFWLQSLACSLAKEHDEGDVD